MRVLKHTKKRIRRERGATAIELSIVAGVLLLLALVIIEYSRLSTIQSSMRYALHMVLSEAVNDERIAPLVWPDPNGTAAQRDAMGKLSELNDLISERFSNLPQFNQIRTRATILPYQFPGGKVQAVALLPPGTPGATLVEKAPKSDKVITLANNSKVTAHSRPANQLPRRVAQQFPVEAIVTFRVQTLLMGDRDISIRVAAFPRLTINPPDGNAHCIPDPTCVPPASGTLGINATCRMGCRENGGGGNCRFEAQDILPNSLANGLSCGKSRKLECSTDEPKCLNGVCQNSPTHFSAYGSPCQATGNECAKSICDGAGNCIEISNDASKCECVHDSDCPDSDPRDCKLPVCNVKTRKCEQRGRNTDNGIYCGTDDNLTDCFRPACRDGICAQGKAGLVDTTRVGLQCQPTEGQREDECTDYVCAHSGVCERRQNPGCVDCRDSEGRIMACSSDADCVNDGDSNMCIDSCYCNTGHPEGGRCAKRLQPKSITAADCTDPSIFPADAKCIAPECDPSKGCIYRQIPDACGTCERCVVDPYLPNTQTLNPQFAKCVPLSPSECKSRKDHPPQNEDCPNASALVSECVRTQVGSLSSCCARAPCEGEECFQCIMAVDAEATIASCSCVIQCYAIQNTKGRGREGCFAGETKIERADGTWVLIGNIRRGELLRNPITGGVSRVAEVVFGPEPKPLYVINVENQQLRVTEYHPFMTPNGLVAAKSLRVNDTILAADGSWDRILTIEAEPFSHQYVWNVVLEGENEGDSPWRNRALNAGGVVSGDLKVQLELQRKLQEVIP